jgi:hypothetical protein
MKTTWKPLVTGILEIIAGGLAVIVGCGLYMSARIANLLTTVPPWINTLLTYPGIPLVLLGALAITGGIYALRRRGWAMALTGSISALIASPLLGLVALILALLSKKEYA